MQGRIIGAGIGGLLMAIALQQRHMAASVYEAKEGPLQQGAGLILAVNAIRVLERLGLADELYRMGNEIQTAYITDEKLRPLSKNLISSSIKQFGYPNISILRSDLQHILLEKLQNGTIEWGKKCIRISEKDRKGILHFEDGSQAPGDYVIAADGIHSMARRQLFPGTEVRKIRQICWRGVAAFDLPERYRHRSIEAWGKGRRFGFSKVNEDFVYWFAVINKHDNDFNFSADLREELKRQFKDFDPPVLQMISDTPEARISRKALLDLPPIQKWHAGRTCLLGDAAHAVTPNLGQGACQAIEDVWVLADLLNASKNPVQAYPEFQKIRKPMTDYVYKWSYRVGEMAHYENRFLVRFRNRIMKRLSGSFLKKRIGRLFEPRYEI